MSSRYTITKIFNFLAKIFIDITLKTSPNIGKNEKHDLILKMAILNSKNRLLFIIFFDFYPIICIGEI